MDDAPPVTGWGLPPSNINDPLPATGISVYDQGVYHEVLGHCYLAILVYLFVFSRVYVPPSFRDEGMGKQIRGTCVGNPQILGMRAQGKKSEERV